MLRLRWNDITCNPLNKNHESLFSAYNALPLRYNIIQK
nr:MAG TPA: hypothetical protein [Caudoviricetes sp.]